MESTHDRVASLLSLMTCFAGIHKKGAGCPVDIRLARTEAGAKTVALMTAYEIITIFLGILSLLFTFGSLLVALLAFLDKRNKRK